MRQVTDDKSLPKEERRRLRVVKNLNASNGVKGIKLTDNAANLAALLESRPHGWDGARRRAYLTRAREVVAGLPGVDRALEVELDEPAGRAERVVGA